MEENQDRPDDDRSVSRILDELEEAHWTHLGEVRHLADPGDCELLAKLAEECEARIESLEAGKRRERLRRICRRLRAESALNEVLPIVPVEDLLPRPGEGTQAFGRPGRRRRPKRAATGSPMPGFEAYHARVTRWIDEKGLSQSSLAKHLDLDPSYLSRAIRGERKNRDLFLKIEELTGIAAPFVAAGEEAGTEPDPDDRELFGAPGPSEPDQVN
jgi:hypothetical protein